MGKLSFSDSKAKGGFFGLTLLFLVPWLLVTLWSLYFVCLGLTGHFMDLAFRGVNIHVIGETAIAILQGIVLFLLPLLGYLYGLWLTAYGLFASHATLPGKRLWGKSAGGMATLLLGASLLVFLYRRAFASFLGLFGGNWTLKNPPGPELMNLPTILKTMLNGPWCLIFVVLAVALLAVGYLALGKVLAERGKVSFAQLWTKGVRAQWYAMLAIYVASLCLTGWAAFGLHDARQEIASAVGRPMTAQAMEEYYCDGQVPDGEFWQRVAKAYEAWETAIRRNISKEGWAFFFEQRDSVQSEIPVELVKSWREVGLDIPEAEAFEALFDEPLPPDARNYTEGFLVGMRLPGLEFSRKICRLEFWRVRMAVVDNDFAVAQAALNRMRNVCDRLAHDNFQICAAAWGSCEAMRCEALAQVIGAGMGNEEWLKGLDGEMADLEKSVEEVRLNTVIYGEATMWADVADGSWNGKYVDGAVPMNALKWLTPQLWWCFVRDKEVFTKAVAEGVDKPLAESKPYQLGLVASVLPALQSSERKWLELKTSFRLVRALIAIELEKRRIGDWPSQPDVELPEDPFAPGSPLRFQYGELEIYRPVWNDEMNYFNKRTETVKGVRVYSVGRNRVDDSGIPRNSSYSDDLALWFPVP